MEIEFRPSSLDFARRIFHRQEPATAYALIVQLVVEPFDILFRPVDCVVGAGVTRFSLPNLG
jgi:hypothetical protein